MKNPRPPKPRNHIAKELWSGAFKQRVVGRKHKDPKKIRRDLKPSLRDHDPRD